MKHLKLLLVLAMLGSGAIPGAVAGPVADGIKRIGKESGREVFNEVERRVLEEYVRTRGGESREDNDDDDDDDRPGNKQKGKGKDKKKQKSAGAQRGNPKGLPPGIQMKLARGGTLPPGIAKKNLPNDVEARLPPVAEGYERIVTAGKVLLVESATGVIADVIDRTTGASRSGSEGRPDPTIGRNYDADPRGSGGGDTPRDAQRREGASDDSDKKWWQIWK